VSENFRCATMSSTSVASHPDRDRPLKLIRRNVTRFKNADWPATCVCAKSLAFFGRYQVQRYRPKIEYPPAFPSNENLGKNIDLRQGIPVAGVYSLMEHQNLWSKLDTQKMKS